MASGYKKVVVGLIWLGMWGGMAACQQQTAVSLPTQIPVAMVATEITMAETAVSTPAPNLPPTWTPPPFVVDAELPAQPGDYTVVPTNTPLPIPTNTPYTPRPTTTAVPPTNDPNIPPPIPTVSTSTPFPTIPAAPGLGPNLLPNPSFEEGWYNLDGIPELQLPNGWDFDWDEGPTGYGNQPWDVWVRPETRVLPANQLPAAERPSFIYDGHYTLKMFKGYGAISFRLTTEVTLEPGTYQFEINVFPDLVMDYTSTGQKVWARDPLSGEVRFIVGDGGSEWIFPTFGRKNTFTHTFTLSETQTLRVGVAVRGRFAIVNNGWFMDDWTLQKVGE